MLIWYFDFTIFTLVNVSHTCLQFYIYIFNFTVTRLSWHVLYYFISKNLYSLQNAQPFIYQLICMQLCKCINCFSKAHNKQLNQYCLNFTIFVIKKKSFKKWFGFGSGWPAKNMGQVTGQPVSALDKKIWVRVRSSQKILTCFVISTCNA